MADQDTLPLFPLHTVLLPGAALGLRVFERRYLDLVRECGRSGTGFGICLILDGQEAGAPAMPAAHGTEALIEDFDTGEDGLLALRVRGRRRFHVQRTRVRDNGLIIGEITWSPPDVDDELRAEHGLMATVLEKIYEHMGHDAAALAPEQIDSAAWVGWRLADLLPLSDQQRLSVLQEDDVHLRLDRLLSLMD
ncbi:MAG: LON peptidase substrate-binding domain-containing protein [Pseudoxanthomonas sp.]